MRKMQTRRKISQTRQNNNSLVTKHSQGPLVPPQGLEIIFWAVSWELSWRHWNPYQEEKLTTWWPDCSHDISCHNSENWPQRNGNWPWNWRLTVPKTIKMTLTRPPMTKFKMPVGAACAGSTYSPSLRLCTPETSLSRFLPLMGCWELAVDTSPPSPQVTGLLNKATFPFLPTLSLEYWLSSSGQLNLSLVTGSVKPSFIWGLWRSLFSPRTDEGGGHWPFGGKLDCFEMAFNYNDQEPSFSLWQNR